MPLSVGAFPVKNKSGKSADFPDLKYKTKISAEYAQSSAEGIQNRFYPQISATTVYVTV